VDTATQKTYRFTFTLGGIPEIPDGVTDAEWSDRMGDVLDEVAGRVLAAGCDDSTLHSTGPMVFLDFDREAGSLAEAVASAIAAVERAGFTVARVDVDAPKG
jgi:hypothetical protein